MSPATEIPAGALIIALVLSTVAWIVIMLLAGFVAHASWLLLNTGWQAIG